MAQGLRDRNQTAFKSHSLLIHGCAFKIKVLEVSPSQEEGSEQLCFLRKQLLTSFQAGIGHLGRHQAQLHVRADIKTTRTGNYGTNSRLAGPAGIWERLSETWKRLCLVSAGLPAGFDMARKEEPEISSTQDALSA